MSARPRPVSLLSLRAFEVAARRLSFTDAGRELHLTQAAISRHVRSLEEEFGKPLFRRLHRQVQLTADGQRLANALAFGFHHINQAVANVRKRAKALRVSVEPGFASRWLIPRLKSFTLSHPDIELQLEASDAMRVVGAEADIAIRYLADPLRRKSPGGRRLFVTESMPVIAAADSSRADRGPEDADVLRGVLLHDDDGGAWRAWFKVAALNGFEGAKHQYLSDHSLALDAALQGNGIALGSPMFLRGDLEAGRLRAVGRSRVTLGSYWLLQARDRATSKSRAEFVRWLCGELARDEDSSPLSKTRAQRK